MYFKSLSRKPFPKTYQFLTEQFTLNIIEIIEKFMKSRSSDDMLKHYSKLVENPKGVFEEL